MKRTNKGAQPVNDGQPPAECVEKSHPTKGNPGQAAATCTQRQKSASSALARIREAARRDSKQPFTSLLHPVNLERLRAAFDALKRDAAPGVDGVTWEQYDGEGLAERLADLHDRVQSERYRAKPSKRAWISKSDGQKRPLGVAALEDKIVQQALSWILQEIWEEDFCGFRYGFRPGRSQHNALDAIYMAIKCRKVNWVLDADIRSFYDTINHSWLMKFVEHRVADPRVLRLIRKFLRAGVSEDGQWSETVVGTPQGSVLSPLLANIYLHYALDLWVKWWRAKGARGEVYIVRYADDAVMGFQYRSDAQRFQVEVRKRLERFGLALHEGKTRLIEFGRFASEDRKERGEGKPETFDFLGFTHICTKTMKGGRFTVRRKTIAKRLRSKIKEVKQTLLRRRHTPVPEQGRWLRSVVQGYFNYHGVPGNREALNTFRKQVNRAWLRALRRRSQKGKALTWERMAKLIATWIPTAKIVHPYPDQRFCV